MGDRLLTASDVAILLKVKPKTALAWASAGYLPSVLLGPGKRQSRRFREKDIMAFIEAGGSGTTRRKRITQGGAVDCQSRGQDLGVLSAVKG